jgi:enhancing lycopene biosynthesis protein 2
MEGRVIPSPRRVLYRESFFAWVRLPCEDMSKPQVGVVLAGCGVFDGAEIREAVLTLLALDQAGAEARCFAPDMPQAHVVDHLAGKPVAGESRNVLVEAARIARGAIEPLSQAKASELDALIVPGGFGAAKNLCTFAFQGPDCTVHPDLARVLGDMHAAQKPIGLICIAPVIGAKLFKAAVTIGDDSATSAAIRAMGGSAVPKAVTEIHVDETHRLVSTPAYMYDARLGDIATGITALVQAVLKLAR